MQAFLISLVVTAATVFGIYNFVPLHILQPFAPAPTFGTTLTTINGSDTLSSSRTTINNNFSALNTGKFELSDWFATTSAANLTTLANLATVGTITSGTWSGTAIVTTKGGTGSTTLSSNQLLLGNGTGNIATVTGYGTSGQYLTSAGAGAAPTWTSTSLDTTLSYNWTGNTLIKNLFASSTMTIAGLAYAWPSVRAASSTVLTQDASGNLLFLAPTALLYKTNAPGTITNTTASTTIFSTSIVGGTLSTDNVIAVDIPLNDISTGGAGTLYVDIGYGGSTTTLSYVAAGSLSNGGGLLKFSVAGNGATNSQRITANMWGGASFAVNKATTGTIAVDSTANKQLVVIAQWTQSACGFAPNQVVATILR